MKLNFENAYTSSFFFNWLLTCLELKMNFLVRLLLFPLIYTGIKRGNIHVRHTRYQSKAVRPCQ